MSALPKIFKKLLLSFLAFLVLFTSFATPAKADGEWYAPYLNDWYTKAYDTSNANSIFGERYTAAQVTWVVYTMLSLPFTITLGPKLTSCVIANIPTGAVSQLLAKLTYNAQMVQCILPAAEKIFNILISDNIYKNSSLFAAIMAPRELSVITHIPGLLSKGLNLHLIPEAQAQTTGFGFQALTPILPLWKFSRNTTYALFVIVIIAMAFMIMFKVKLNPQTSITIQSAIPKIVIALILVTFSYAIAGLLIDLMYVIFGLVSLVVSPLFLDIFKPTDIYSWLIGAGGGGGVFTLVSVIFGIMALAIGLPILLIGLAIGGVGGIVGGGIMIVLFAVVFIAAIKVMWALLKAYALTLIMTIIAPFYIVLGVVIPAFGIGAWIRTYLANLSVFLVTSILSLFSIIFLGSGLVIMIPDLITDVLSKIAGLPFNFTFLSPPTSAGWPPLLGGGGGTLMAGMVMAGVGFVLFTIIPKSNELIQALIKGGQFNYGAALDEATNPLGVRTLVTTAGREAVGAGIKGAIGRRLPGELRRAFEAEASKANAPTEQRQDIG